MILTSIQGTNHPLPPDPILKKDLVNAVNVFGNYPLIYAANRGNWGIAAKLLKAQANPNHKNHQGVNTLMMAFLNGHVLFGKLLLKQSIELDINAVDKDGDFWI